jgi:hypothetical protein
MMGKRINSVEVIGEQGKLIQNVSELPSGIYFYVISFNGSNIAHEKLIINR